MMPINLTPVIDAFLKAKNDYDSEAFAACFTDDAVVEDEGREIGGKAAIKEWIANSNEKYQDTVTAAKLAELSGETVLTAEVAGNFPGSPAFLDFHFVISKDKICRLRILPSDG